MLKLKKNNSGAKKLIKDWFDSFLTAELDEGEWTASPQARSQASEHSEYSSRQMGAYK